MVNLKISPDELRNCLASQTEWLIIHPSGKTFALQKTEIEITQQSDKLLFGFMDEHGFQTWRIADGRFEEGEIILFLSRSFGKDREKIRLVPRVASGALTEAVELARLEKANRIARLIKQSTRAARLVRVELNKENGRFAQIIFRNPPGGQIAAISDVSETLTPEILLSSAILWLTKLKSRKKNAVANIWILDEEKQAKKLQKLHALLRDTWKSQIKIIEVTSQNAARQDGTVLEELPALSVVQLWQKKPKKVRPVQKSFLGEVAQKIIALAPDEIDVIFSRQGATLRFEGLAFARIRKVFDREKTWFGVEQNKTALSENNFEELLELIENLKNYRRFDSPNMRHEYFRAAPEAWLEAMLRRNIRLLDANLILSPLHHQFRAEKDKIDLLALRRDGRLIIVELKVAPDREMIFQAADYWRKIEAERQSGNLQKANLFGTAEIADAPPICYLVAPTLSFHRDFTFLAKTITPEIEIHRFNLAENWRADLRVLERINLSAAERRQLFRNER